MQVLCLIGDKIVIRDLDNHCQKSTGNSKELGHKHDLIEFKVDYMQDDSYLRVQSEARKEESQQRMYGALGVPCIETALDGYNTTILAYGQTGSGKTYTMMGDGTEAGKGLGASEEHRPRSLKLQQMLTCRYLDWPAI